VRAGNRLTRVSQLYLIQDTDGNVSLAKWRGCARLARTWGGRLGCGSGALWGGVGGPRPWGAGFAGRRYSAPGEYNNNIMSDKNSHGPQYPAQGGAKITGDRQRDLETQGVTSGLATCDPEQGVPAQGILGSNVTCATSETTESQEWQSVPSRRLAAIGDPLSRRQRKNSAKKAARDSERGKSPAVKLTGKAETDDRRDVGRSSSSEAGASDTGSASRMVSADEEGLLSSPLEMATETDAAPSCSVEAGPSGEAAGRKRKPEVGPTPPQQQRRKKPKRGPALGATFEQAEKDDLLGVVLVSGQPYTILSRVQLNSVRRKLLIKLEETIDLGEAVPTFQESGVRYSRFHLSCTTQESFAWLKSTIDNMEIDGDGGEDTLHLQLVTPAEVPRLLRAEVYISGPPPGVPKFIKLIKAQNRGLHTDRWVLRHQQSTEGGQLMVWGIDQESATALEAVNYQPHFGLGRVTFRVSHGPAREAAGQ